MLRKNGSLEKCTLGLMDASEKWMIFRFTPCKPNHHLPNTDVLPKIVLQTVLAAKWLVQHSSTSLKQQRRPYPSLLYKSFLYADPAQKSYFSRDTIPFKVMESEVRRVRRGRKVLTINLCV